MLRIVILSVLFMYIHCIKYEAPDDCQWRINKGDEVSLTCKLSSINGDFESTNFSVIPSEHTTFLSLYCSTQVKSKLPEKVFSHLNRLRQFQLTNCKLTKWQTNVLFGLNDLRNLTINTFNNDWKLEFSSGSFNAVKSLEYLDLSFNNLNTFPEYLFCPLTNLVTLNVSRNNLQDISDLKFTTSQNKQDENITEIIPKPSCNLEIQILDASYNSFGHIPGNTLSSLRRLSELRINDNGLISVSDRALQGLKNLRILDLSNNKIIALPSGLFHECNDIRELYLQNNTLVTMAPDLFTGLTHLLALDLSKNKLTSSWLNSNTFSGLIRLVLLNLSYNRINKLQRDFFKDLYTLQILNLEYNLIEILPNETFAAMKNLHTLVLSYNRLKNIEATSFTGLYALSQLALDNNALSTLHSDSLRNCSALQDLTLNGNAFASIPAALSDMRLLKTLDLGENNLQQIEKPGFKGMTNLQGLRLIRNELTKLTKKSFSDLPSLQILNIANNKIKIIENETFISNLNLQAIRLDSNEISNIVGLFSHLNKLEWLNISDNEITKFDYKYIPITLEWLDMRKNNIGEIEDTLKQVSDMRVRSFDISYNKITRIPSTVFSVSIELLFLNDNQITTVESNTFINKPNLTRVDLYANQIVGMDLSALRLSPVSIDKQLPEFYIGGNPYQCDCTMEWLQRVNALELRQHPRVMDLESVYCKLPYSRHQRFIPLIEADSSHFVCKYEAHCFALCHCCDFDACDCKMKCPSNCTCYHDQSWSAANIVDCFASNHIELPSNIPMDATIVYLDGNSFHDLKSHLFIGRKNLLVLYLNNSKIDTIHNHTFAGLKRLRILHLEENRLNELQGFEFQHLEDITELYLHKNRLTSINNSTFAELKNLQVLRLDGNMLHTYPVWQLSSIQYLVRITLADNNWSCHCQYIRDFRSWLRVNLAKVSDSANIACVLRVQPDVDGSVSKKLGPHMSDFNSTACSSFLIGNGYSEFESQLKLPLILAIVTALIILICLICVIVSKKRNKSSFWIQCGHCYKASVSTLDVYEERSRQYDAFIIYSIRDDEFTTQILAPALEPQLKLCLQHRENHNYILDTIENSRRIVIVLSQHFLITEWRRPELRSALKEAIQRDLRRKRRVKLIIINLTTLPPRDLDPDLRVYLNKAAVCIKWKDKRFWQRLKSSMPEVKINNKDCTTVTSRELSTRDYASLEPARFLPRSLESHLQNELWE